MYIPIIAYILFNNTSFILADPPEISVERPVVFSGEGHEAMLVCIIHGETQPEVCYKNLLKGHGYILKLRHITPLHLIHGLC